MNPREKRAKAAELQAQAKTIYESKKTTDAPDFTPEELRSYDEAIGKATTLLNEAEAEEAREKALNDLDTRIKTGDSKRSYNPLPHNDPANEKHSYSLLKALRQAASKGAEPLDGLELEVSQEISKRTGKDPQGFYMPLDLGVGPGSGDVQYRDLTTSTGAGAVATITQQNTFIEMLRNATLTRRLGVQFLNGMTGNFSIPRQTAGGTAYWVSEGNAPTESTQTVGQLLFSPHTVGAFSDISRKFLIQASFDAEMFTRNDLATVIAIELDRVTFNGAGSGAEPTGVIVDPNVNVIPLGTNGGAETYANLLLMESTLAVQNAPMNRVAFVSTPGVRATTKQIARLPSTNTPLWDDTTGVLGYPAYASNQMPSTLSKGTATGTLHSAILGDWSQAIWAFWTGLDVLVDPYTGGTAGTIRVIMLQDCDFHLRQPKAFAVQKDIIP